MEELLAQARAAEQPVHALLKTNDEPIVKLLHAFDEYRQISKACNLADFENGAAQRELELWSTHTEGKKYFQRALASFRKQPANDQPVATRQLIKFYLQFIKDSQRFYRGYIHELSTTLASIPELEAVAHQVKTNGLPGASSPPTSPELRDKVRDSCHQTLIYLGDLSRYRASEKLDKTPDFGPAIGYYTLACTLRPTSGMGHHQLAVVALEQRQHLRAIYHLYRAMVVDHPHPNAANNLKLEFEKTNAAWDRGELIQKGQPNDPEASKNTLVGWFIRLHSMLYRGQPFRGYDELVREVLGQLAAEVKHRALDSTLMRMLMVNMAAQLNAGEKFQQSPDDENQTALLQFFRFNVKTFMTLLRVFYDELKAVDVSNANYEDVNLADRLTDTMRRILPALRLYSSWLLSTTRLIHGLSADPVEKEAIDQFWIIYAKVVDLVATLFPIWEFDDLPQVTYMLEEDADTLGFLPVGDERNNGIWYDKQTGALKPRFSDPGVIRTSVDDEMLARVQRFLADGSLLAEYDDQAPIKLRHTRILHRDAEDVEPVQVLAPAETPKTATVAANGPSVNPAPKLEARMHAPPAANGPAQVQSPPVVMANGVSGSSSSHSRHAQLSRMVDDLVDDDDSNNPVTPPQQLLSNPTVVTKGDVSYAAVLGSGPDFAQLPNYSCQPRPKAISTAAMPSTSPALRSPKNAPATTAIDRLQSVSSLWNDMPQQSPDFPSGLPTWTLTSPAQLYGHGHSRVNSASSIRSRTSQNVVLGIADSWSSIESAPRTAVPAVATGFGNGLVGSENANVASPLLFGAGGGLWSTGSIPGMRTASPPDGQGG